MRGVIIKVHPPKSSRNGDTSFVRVEFELADGSWAKTDICTTFRNWKNWDGLLTVGNELEGLQLRKAEEVNADCKPNLVQ